MLRILKVEEILLGKLKIQLEKLTFPLNHLEARVVPSHKSCQGRPAFSSIFILTKVALHSWWDLTQENFGIRGSVGTVAWGKPACCINVLDWLELFLQFPITSPPLTDWAIILNWLQILLHLSSDRTLIEKWGRNWNPTIHLLLFISIFVLSRSAMTSQPCTTFEAVCRSVPQCQKSHSLIYSHMFLLNNQKEHRTSL